MGRCLCGFVIEGRRWRHGQSLSTTTCSVLVWRLCPAHAKSNVGSIREISNVDFDLGETADLCRLRLLRFEHDVRQAFCLHLGLQPWFRMVVRVNLGLAVRIVPVRRTC